jgi:hypothetical protein
MSKPKTKVRANFFWAMVTLSAGLLGLAITGIVPWWAVLLPWALYVVLLLGIFSFIGLIVVMFRKELFEEMEKTEK